MIRLTILALLFCSIANAQSSSKENWRSIFNGKNLDGWTVKIRGYEPGDNFGNTFSAKNGCMVVNYSAYDSFRLRYGHIFYNQELSYYKIRLDYRFIGEQARGGEGWAFRNSGIMVHGQPASSMLKDQDFPISVEVQLLGGRGDGSMRPTCNVCTPGTNIHMADTLTTTHCINSSSKTYDGDQWVHAEVEVYGDSLIRHFVNGELVLSYENPETGGGTVHDFDPAFKPDGRALAKGSISLQSESHPVEFKNIQILDLEGCMDPAASNYKSYYVKSKPESCVYRKKS